MPPEDSATKPAIAMPSLPPLPENDAVRAAGTVVERLQAAGHSAHFVGGFVRDWLLGIDHEDVDVATSAHPEEVIKLFESSREVGARFGVVIVRIGKIQIEVTTYRTEGAYTDYRRPDEVKFGSLQQDATRRDFTINALYYDPATASLKDFHAGALDLRRRVLRTVGPPIKRFGEDALRLMRAVRFAARYDLEIEPRTRKALISKAANLQHISKERVGEELLRILTGPSPGRAFRMMSDLGLWPHVIAEIETLKGVEQGKKMHPEGDVATHTALVLDHMPEDPAPALALAALLHDIGKPSTVTREGRIRFQGHQRVGAAMARDICRRLRVDNDTTAQVVDLVQHHMQFMDVRRMKPASLKRFLGRPDFQLHLDLHRADCLASHGDLDAYEFCLEQRRLLAIEHGDAMKPRPLATGDDLIAMGLEPGPQFKAILDALHDQQLEGKVKTREESLEFLRRKAENP
ncbi:CCA tRNA nucleotidyltransferase [Candidatus Sumerlaeota bacterium]|nr:CCA tRNA nucleotidyltransferase [Candidatus Sumerlaeota bacterium]